MTESGKRERRELAMEARSKITIPSDLRLHPLALSVNVRTLADPRSPKPEGSGVRNPCGLLPSHRSFTFLPVSLAEHQPSCELEDFNFNLSGSDPIVANRAGVILPYEIFLSTKKRSHERIIL
jgi:hypothetical protein